MKTTKSLLLLVLSLFLVTSTAIAGKSKEEKETEKEWKKKLKKLEWEDYKKLLEEKDQLKKDKKVLSENEDALEDEISQLKANNSQLKATLDQMETELNNAMKAPEPKVKEPVVKNVASSSTDNFNEGVAFKVQIGAFKNLKSAASYSKNNDNFGAEADNDVTMYTIGEFRDYSDADALRKYLVKMGVKGAWVVSYKNGKRVHIKEVIDHIKK